MRDAKDKLKLDPEVIADLKLRESSTRDKTRTGEVEWTSPVLVESWKCRAPRCSNVVEVTQDVVDQHRVFNGYLQDRGERDIPTDAIVLCPDCKKLAASYRNEALLERNRQMTADVQHMKASPDPRNEHDCLRRLRANHHPDIDGLLDVLVRRLEGEKGSKRSKKGDL